MKKRMEVNNMENRINGKNRGLTTHTLKQQDGRKRPPEHYLRQNLAEVRRLNQQDEEVVLGVKGKRYRSVFLQYRAVYPKAIPEIIHLATPNVDIVTGTLDGHNAVTQEPIQLTDEFWGTHGYDFLQNVSTGNGCGRNGNAEL